MRGKMMLGRRNYLLEVADEQTPAFDLPSAETVRRGGFSISGFTVSHSRVASSSAKL